ncbi:MAG: pyridoxal-phosphate dependent enzyme [Planctomycetota bacterium]|nr:MAG: pyridoxal-phosphate dependent enzyme [Planctomycetota bacterium]
MTTAPSDPWTDGATPDFSLLDAVTLDHVRAAADRIAGIAHRTPVVTSRTINGLTGANVLFKCENLQRVGAFKFRGAYNALSKLPKNTGGVIAYSSGNHAQGVALAAALLGIRAVIVMPTNAPKTKRAATEAYLQCAPDGSRVVAYDSNEQQREEVGARIAEEEGLTLIPPYDHPDIIAGQGTLALELIDQAVERDHSPLDRLYVCTGGGGVLSGCATVFKALAPDCEVIGVEPALGDDITRSFADGVLRTVHNPATIADGARTHYAGRHTLPIILKRVDRMETVGDPALARAMFLYLERMRLVVEPTGALALAGLLQDAERNPDQIRGKNIAVVITGGNLDLDAIPDLRAIAEERD